MSRRTSHHRDDFIAVGLVFVTEHGVAVLTARALAEAMGVSHTVMYRHFTNMDDLVQAIISRFYAEMEMPARVGETPRARLESFIVNVRRTFTAYPNLVGYLASGSGEAPAGLQMSRLALALLADLGLTGDDLAVSYQMLESYLIGATLYDHLGAPGHFETRRTRYRLTDHPVLDAATPSVEAVGRLNDGAFEWAIAALLDACEARVAGGRG
jgi:AcrR family transcriptional regulator